MNLIRKALAYPFVYAGIGALKFGAFIVGGREYAAEVISRL